MSLEFRYDGTLLTDVVRLTGGSGGGVAGLPSSAWAGEPSAAGLQIEDPDGVLDFEGWHTFTVDETACSKPRIFTGWIFGKRISRGLYRTGPGRIWDCDIIDQNEVFSFMAYRTGAAKRPAETDLERVTFALADGTLSWGLNNYGLANLTDNPGNYGESDYTHQYPAELFMSLSSSAKNFYAYYDDDEGGLGLFWDRPAAPVRTSSLRISNDRSEVDGITTFYPMIDAEQTISPENTFSRIHYGFAGQWVIRSRPATRDPWSFPHRDQVYQTDRVGKLATAIAQADQYLEDRKGEVDTVTCMVRLPAEKVNLLHAGERVEAMFTHLKGYDDMPMVRVIRRNVVPSPGRRDRYDVHLELSNDAPVRGPGKGGGSVFPHRPPAPPALVQYKIGPGTVTLDDTPSPGNILLAWSAIRATSGTGAWDAAFFTEIDAITNSLRSGQMAYRIVEPGDGPTWAGPLQSASILMEWNATAIDTSASLNDQAAGPLLCGGSVTPTAGVIAVVIGGASIGDGDLDIISVVPDAGVTELMDQVGSGGSPNGFLGYKLISSTSGSYSIGGTSTNTHDGDTRFGGVTVVLSGGAVTDFPPGSGQPVRGEASVPVADGTTTTFATRFPYVEGSVTVYVDRQDQTAAVVSYDVDAHTFTLGFAPAVGELVETDYTGAPG